MREQIIDNFAGGGGASTGIHMALGISPDYAINHDDVALAMHEINHPTTKHLCNNIWKIDPDEIEGPIGLGWFSPDCKHFSKAKGGKPVEKGIRDLAWVVVRWAKRRQGGPRIIILENVEEFQTWGPLGDDNKPDVKLKGETFRKWTNELRKLGYKLEWKELRACDYGAPTIRKRLFLIARNDGEPIVWPEPTHGDPTSKAVKAGKLKPWRTAAEIIDWSLPCPSIFDTAEEIMAKFGLRAVRPLQPATMARIAKGVKRYVLDAAKPFIVNLTHHGGERTESIDDPMMTVTGAHRGEKAVAVPFVTGVGGRMGQTEPRGADQPAQTLTAKADSVIVTPFVSAAQHGGSSRDADEPIHTIAASRKDQNQVVMPYLARTAHGEVDKNGKKRGQGTHTLEEPFSTVLASPDHALIAPHLTKFRANSVGSGMDEPAPTVTANSFIKRPGGAAPLGIVAPHLMTMRNAQKPFQGGDEPTHTVTAGGAHMHLVAAFLAQHNIDGRTGEGNPGRDVKEPLSTVLQSGSHQGVVSAGLTILKGSDRRDRDVHDPAPAVLAEGNHIAETRAFISKYYGTGEGQDVTDPAHTVTTKDRLGVVTVDIDGEPYVITDIGMRMLTPRELFRAQGFDDSYIIDRRPDGRPITKTDQVSKCGNSVCPPMAEALVRANFSPRDIERREPPEFFMEAAE